MRLEIEPTVAVPHVSDEMPASDNLDEVSAEAKTMLNQGIKAARSGNRPLARMSLQRAAELQPGNESAWLWLASISEYPEELLGFLNHVLEINPENERAIEWKAATHSLLSKTFVQRGIDACEDNQKDFAAECFQTALEYDDRNATAYTWMASLADSNVVKASFLQKAVAIEPHNESALAALDAVKKGIVKDRLTEAKTAVVAGNNVEALAVLDDLLSVSPESVEAWIMRSHLAENIDEKIRCFESILALDPENVTARSSRDSLLAIFGTMEAAEAERSAMESESTKAARYDAAGVPEPEIDRSPTQELEMPAGFSEQFSGRDDTDANDIQSTSAVVEDEDPAYYEPQREVENEEYTVPPDAEPYAPHATEAAESPSYDLEAVEPEQTPDADPFGTEAAMVEEVEFVYSDPYSEADAVQADDDSSIDSGDLVIPMPQSRLPEVPVTPTEEPVVEVDVMHVTPESIECAFCGQTNEPQTVSCQGCMAVLTLSDLEMLLANQSADKAVLRRAVEEMERQRAGRGLEPHELTTLGIGHLNLRNLQLGYSCLSEASRLDPDNVVLSGQVNSLHIRLEEIRLQEEAHLRMPKGKSILVVDDSPTVRKLIAGKLEKSGHDVVCANDGVEAMERLEDFVPDLILLDITMPRMDGYQACKTIRSNSATKDVPIVMISGKDGFFDKVRGRMAGTTGYITKPFGPETLMKAVEMYLRGEVPDLDDEV